MVYTLGLGKGIDGDRKEASPREGTAAYLIESCAVNSCYFIDLISIENRSWWLGLSFFILNYIKVMKQQIKQAGTNEC